jgi:tetratricopeptide (TPR) repeat protein
LRLAQYVIEIVFERNPFHEDTVAAKWAEIKPDCGDLARMAARVYVTNMKAMTLCLLLLFSFEQVAVSCANLTGSATKYNGDSTSISPKSSGLGMLRYALRKNLQPDGTKMEAQLRGATNFNDRSDYSVALMYLRRANEAVELLEQLEKEKPGEYFVAANLGTAYELAGNNEQALRWIKEGIRRNPDSHEGTEWLHVRILEAKIAQKADPHYFENHSVLDLRPDETSQELVVGGKRFPHKQVAEAIRYQLSERLKFVKPPDAAVASLLFDYAAIEAATATLERAKKILQMAVEYGYPTQNVRPLMDLYDRRIAWRETKEYSGYACLGMLGVAVLWWLYKRGIFVLSAKDLKRA